MGENAHENVDLKNAKDVDIKDSNVKITINPSESKTTGVAPKETDYVSLGIIVAIILAMAAYFFVPGFGDFIKHDQQTNSATEQTQE